MRGTERSPAPFCQESQEVAVILNATREGDIQALLSLVEIHQDCVLIRWIIMKGGIHAQKGKDLLWQPLCHKDTAKDKI